MLEKLKDKLALDIALWGGLLSSSPAIAEAHDNMCNRFRDAAKKVCDPENNIERAQFMRDLEETVDEIWDSFKPMEFSSEDAATDHFIDLVSKRLNVKYKGVCITADEKDKAVYKIFAPQIGKKGSVQTGGVYFDLYFLKGAEGRPSYSMGSPRVQRNPPCPQDGDFAQSKESLPRPKRFPENKKK